MPITVAPEIEIPQPGTMHSVKAVQKTHPDYATAVSEYHFLRDSYTGQGGYETYKGGYDQNGDISGTRPNTTNLQRYPREAESKWFRRLEGAYYPNWIRRIVGIWAGLLSRESPSPRNYPTEVEDWQGVGDEGWNTQRAQVLPWLMVYPKCYLLTDKPQADPGAVSAAQAEDTEPYVRLIHPDRMLDWLEDDAGQLLYAKYETDMDRIIDPLEGHESGKRYTVMTADGWWYYEVWGDVNKNADTPVVESGYWPDTVSGHLPIAVYHSGVSGDGEEDISPIEYISRVMMRLYNVLSQKAATEDGSCFPIFRIPMHNPDDVQKIKWGDSTAIGFPHDATNVPDFAGYDVEPITHMTLEAERLIKQLKDLAAMSFGDDDAADTGIAKAYAFMMTDVTLASFVAAVEAVEMQVMDLIARWQGVDGLPDGATPGFPRTFDLVAAREAIDNANALLEAGLPPVVASEVKRLATSKYLVNSPPDVLQAIDDAFDKAAEEDEGDPAAGWAVAPADDATRGAQAQALEAPDIKPR